jgi:hypothetical protein
MIDADTNGGIPLEKAVGDLRQQARMLREDLPVGNQRIADLIERKADEFEEQYGKHGKSAPVQETQNLSSGPPPEFKPPEWTEEQWQRAEDEWNGKHVRDDAHKTIGDKTKPGGKGEAAPDLDRALSDLEKLRANAKGVAAKAIDEQIEKLKAERPATAEETADTVAQKAPAGVVIPTKQFRREVTELLKHADSSMGEIEGSKRHALLSQLYDAGKEVIDNHIDGSGVSQAAKDQLRKINDQYFLVSRAEAAIESRGYKEANKPGGFHVPHTVAQATRNLTGAAGLATAAGFAAANPHSIPYIAATLAASKVLPAAAKSANWWAANGGYTRAINKLAELATKAESKSTFVSQAAGAGLGAAAARRIYEAAHPQQGATP